MPLGFPTAGLDEAWFGIARLGRTVAAGALLELLRSFGLPGCLSFECEMKHLLRHHLPKGDDEVFEFFEGGTPGRAVRAPDTIRQVFCDSFEIRSDGVDMRGLGFDKGHPWLPVEVRMRGGGEF